MTLTPPTPPSSLPMLPEALRIGLYAVVVGKDRDLFYRTVADFSAQAPALEYLLYSLDKTSLSYGILPSDERTVRAQSVASAMIEVNDQPLADWVLVRLAKICAPGQQFEKLVSRAAAQGGLDSVIHGVDGIPANSMKGFFNHHAGTCAEQRAIKKDMLEEYTRKFSEQRMTASKPTSIAG